MKYLVPELSAVKGIISDFEKVIDKEIDKMPHNALEKLVLSTLKEIHNITKHKEN